MSPTPFTLCASNLSQAPASPVGSADLEDWEVTGQKWEGGRFCEILREECNQMVQGWGPGCQS